MAGGFAAFENFDAIVGVGVVRGGDVDSKIETHLIKAVIDGGSGEDADAGVLEAEGFAGGFEVGENPFGRFAGVAAE